MLKNISFKIYLFRYKINFVLYKPINMSAISYLANIETNPIQIEKQYPIYYWRNQISKVF